MKYGELKVDELLLVAKYIEINKDMFSRCPSRLKIWAKGVVEVNEGYIQRLNAITMKKLKKGRIREVKYSITILLNSNNIDEIDCLARNTK